GAGDDPVRRAATDQVLLRGADPEPGGGAGREGARRAAHALRPGRRGAQDLAGDRGGAGAEPRAHPPDREQGQGEAAAQPARAGPARRAELMRRAEWAVAALALAPALALGQVLIPSPRPITGGSQELPPVGVEGHYGPAEPE